jgi:hypothetical protein
VRFLTYTPRVYRSRRQVAILHSDVGHELSEQHFHEEVEKIQSVLNDIFYRIQKSIM